MKLRHFLIVCAPLLIATSTLRAEAPRPNILYFYVDDMGWGSIGPNGQEERAEKGLPVVKTPNLDRLAAEGVNFTRAYGATVCSPARSAQQIGFHQGHAFADRNDPDNAKKAMRTDDVTMGDSLSAAGYATGYWGKWGYGGTKDQVDPKIVNVQTLPTSHGYQHVLTELHHVRAHTFFQPTLWSAPAAAGARGGLELVPNSLSAMTDETRYPDTFTKHRSPDYPATAYCDDAYCFAALDFVRKQAVAFRETKQPFFGLLAVQVPHAPFDEVATLPEWDAAYRDDPHFADLATQSQQWAAMVTRIDAHFGLILDALEDPNGDGDRSDSVSDETLVIFMSDNGGPRGRNNEEYDANGGLRGNKGSIHEGGIRVPTIMRWPAAIGKNSAGLKAGTNCNEVIDVTDLLPTFCELAGVPAPIGLDGVSIAPLLSQEAGTRRKREFLIHEAGKASSIIRGGDKLIRYGSKKWELYDLDADPGETNDLASQKPGLVEELMALLLGERVTEPKGFANTYHHWSGTHGASANEAKNWSDYAYENEGIVYLEEKGAPSLSWTARMQNATEMTKIARARKDLSFLGLGIGGDGSRGDQELILSKGVTLTGRNEIRIENRGILSLINARVESLRWVEIDEGGTLQGKGAIDAEVFNAGTMTVDLALDKEAENASAGLFLARDYQQGPEGRLRVVFENYFGSAQNLNSLIPVKVSGQAHLAGKLEIHWRNGNGPSSGQRSVLMKASSFKGQFDCPEDLLTTSDGTILRLHYLPDRVEIEVVSTRSIPSS